ncbi:hypothetical protein KIN20_010657 [Parelaphostrongylus tenuis]|uniref:Uncharacterized protein n=1 Tax=Parelaphostrongylus tenuis TaxID=148309 RepID=A0AAD5MS69_PARTN|nr:hypothetical protein KIN20_010657 [Parelaphostrongylus tenuis]
MQAFTMMQGFQCWYLQQTNILAERRQEALILCKMVKKEKVTAGGDRETKRKRDSESSLSITSALQKKVSPRRVKRSGLDLSLDSRVIRQNEVKIRSMIFHFDWESQRSKLQKSQDD